MKERFEIVEKAIAKLLEEKKYATMRDILVTMNPSDIAATFDVLEHEKIPLLFRLLPKELAAETFVEMELEQQELLIRSFSDNELKEIVDELFVTTRRRWWRKCPPMWCGGFWRRPIRKCASPSIRSCGIRKTPQVPL